MNCIADIISPRGVNFKRNTLYEITISSDVIRKPASLTPSIAGENLPMYGNNSVPG